MLEELAPETDVIDLDVDNHKDGDDVHQNKNGQRIET